MLVELHIIYYLLRNNGTLGPSVMSYLGQIQKKFFTSKTSPKIVTVPPL